MRAVVQRVSEARVRVDGSVVGAIGTGLLVLVGVSPRDGDPEVELITRKIADLRILRNDRSVSDDPAAAGILLISQFTLYGNTRKGRRPAWNGAAPAEVAEPLIERIVDDLRGRGLTVATGRFGSDMAVESVNDGPVTVLLDSDVAPRTR